MWGPITWLSAVTIIHTHQANLLGVQEMFHLYTVFPATVEIRTPNGYHGEQIPTVAAKTTFFEYINVNKTSSIFQVNNFPSIWPSGLY